MSYVLYKKNTSWSREPRVTISSLGRFHFNSAATRQLSEQNIQHLHLFWDSENKKIAMKPAAALDNDTFKLHYFRKGKGSGFAAKTFLKDIRYKNGVSAVFRYKWDGRTKMLEFSINDRQRTRNGLKQLRETYERSHPHAR